MHVVIAGGCSMMLEGFRSLLESTVQTHSIRQSDTYDGLCALLCSLTVDLLILDLDLLDQERGRLLMKLRRENPGTKLMVFTGSPDRKTILDCLAAGIHGYVRQNSSASDISKAIRLVMEGSIYVPPTLAELPEPHNNTDLASGKRQAATNGQPTLTGRQAEVMKLLEEGLSTKLIAKRLSLGVGTVKVHLSALYRTLDVNTRNEAVHCARQMYILP